MKCVICEKKIELSSKGTAVAMFNFTRHMRSIHLQKEIQNTSQRSISDFFKCEESVGCATNSKIIILNDEIIQEGSSKNI